MKYTNERLMPIFWIYIYWRFSYEAILHNKVKLIN